MTASTATTVTAQINAPSNVMYSQAAVPGDMSYQVVPHEPSAR